jgi:uncharacterized protein YgbK (DUF1537 family)
MRIAAGPAGLAGVIAQQIDAPRSTPPPLPSVRSCLVVNGSLHPQAALQVQHLGTDGAWRILQRAHPAGAEPAAVAQENARYLLQEVAASAPDAVLIIGGDTAFAVVAALGLPVITPIGEVVPGVPISRIGNLLLITKAGGFGSTDVLRRIRALLDSDDLRNHNR